jgi:hypothetical protein
MRPLRYSINITLDGCSDHRLMFTDEELFRQATENLKTKHESLSSFVFEV